MRFLKRADEGYRLFTRGQSSFALVHLSTTVKVVQYVRFLNATPLPQLAKQKERRTKGQCVDIEVTSVRIEL